MDNTKTNLTNINNLKYKLIDKKIDNIKHKYEATNMLEDLLVKTQMLNIVSEYNISNNYTHIQIYIHNKTDTEIEQFMYLYMLINKVRQKPRLNNEIASIKNKIDKEVIDKTFFVILSKINNISLNDNNIDSIFQGNKLTKTNKTKMNIYNILMLVTNIQYLDPQHYVVKHIFDKILYIDDSMELAYIQDITLTSHNAIKYQYNLEYPLTIALLHDYFKKHIKSKYKDKYLQMCIELFEPKKSSKHTNQHVINYLKIVYTNNTNMLRTINKIEKEQKEIQKNDNN